MEYKEQAYQKLRTELFEKKTIYSKLSKEYQVYESLLVSSLNDAGIIKSSEVDTEDPTYIAWAREESISLSEYLRYAISQNWIDIAKLSFEQQYADSDMMFDKILAMF